MITPSHLKPSSASQLWNGFFIALVCILILSIISRRYVSSQFSFDQSPYALYRMMQLKARRVPVSHFFRSLDLCLQVADFPLLHQDTYYLSYLTYQWLITLRGVRGQGVLPRRIGGTRILSQLMIRLAVHPNTSRLSRRSYPGWNQREHHRSRLMQDRHSGAKHSLQEREVNILPICHVHYLRYFVTVSLPTPGAVLHLLLASFPALNGFDGCGVGGNIINFVHCRR